MRTEPRGPGRRGTLHDLSRLRHQHEEQQEPQVPQVAFDAEGRLRVALDTIDLMVVILDANARVEYCNRALLRSTGWRLEEVLGRRWWDVFAIGEDGGERLAFLQDVRVGSLPARTERAILTRGGERRLVSWSTVVERNPVGDVVGVTMIGQDVTELREGEAWLRDAERRSRMLLEQIPAIVFIDALEGHSTTSYVSPQIETMLGFSVEEWLSDPSLWEDRLHPEDRERVLAASSEANATGSFSEEYRMIARGGRVEWIQEETALVHDEDGHALYWQGVMLDITQRKESEAQLREAETKFKLLVEQLPAMTYVDVLEGSDPNAWPSAYMSPQVKDMLGYSPEEWTSDPELWQARLHPDDRARILEDDRHHYEMHEPAGAEYRLIARDGRVVWVHDESVFINDESGVPRLELGVMLDVTRRKEAEEQLRRAEVRYKTLVEHMPAISYIQRLDQDVDAFYMSPQVEDILGYSPDEFKDPTFWDDHVHPLDRARALAEDLRTDQTHEDFEIDYRMIAADGRTVWIRDQAVLVRDGEGEPWFWQGFMIDVTEVKHAEEELRRALALEREAVGRLRTLDQMKSTFLTAVSHELRSPLAVILGAAETLRSHEGAGLDDSERLELLDALVSKGKELNALLSDLLDVDRLARGIIQPRRKPTDVATLIRRVIEQTPRKGRTIRGPRKEVRADVDPAMVERIIENLVSNAVRHTPPDARIWARVGRRNGGVLITVDDDGPGVPPEDRDRIFEPFQQGPAAQPHSPGVGIGLSLVARFAELHGGSASVKDRRDGGASFRVFLPDEPSVGSPGGFD